MSIFGFLKKEKTIPKAKSQQPKYIYRPFENAMACRVEYREGAGWIYPGWGKGLLFKIEGDRICSPSGELCYIIIEGRVYDSAGEKVLYRIAGNEVYAPGVREPVYLIKDSIRVQGTI